MPECVIMGSSKMLQKVRANICSWLVLTSFDRTTFCFLLSRKCCKCCKWLSRESWYCADSPLCHEFHIWPDSTRITRTDKKYWLCFCKNPVLHFYRMRLGSQKLNKYKFEANGFKNFHFIDRGKKLSQCPRECMKVLCCCLVISGRCLGRCLGRDHKIEDLLINIFWKAWQVCKSVGIHLCIHVYLGISFVGRPDKSEKGNIYIW